MKILVTAFDPFGGEKVNPAALAVSLLKENIAGASIIKLTVPTIFNKSIATVYEEINKENPDVVICVGQAGGRSHITVEKVALNLNDARIPDNEGNQPIDTTIFADGETAYFSTLPIKAMVSYMKENGVPATVSYTAGTFVCNHLMYGTLYHIHNSFSHIRGGFIHVPYIPEQVSSRNDDMPSMSIDMIVLGLELAITATVENYEDIKTSGGTLH